MPTQTEVRPKPKRKPKSASFQYFTSISMEGKTKRKGSWSLIVARYWEDLNIDCLINIFGRVGLECLILDIPFVCKSWYKASLDPHSYKLLDFQFMSLKSCPWAITILQNKPYELMDANFPIAATPSPQFMKIAVNRSAGLATEVVFHTCLLTDNILEYILERCPALKILTLPECEGYDYYGREDYVVRENDECLLISKLPNLESLMTLNSDRNLKDILNQIHIHCPNFVSLGFQDFLWYDDTASALVALLPNIKHLVLRGSTISRGDLTLIISGCRKLELLDVSRCTGIDANDAEILKVASHIKTFESEGAIGDLYV